MGGTALDLSGTPQARPVPKKPVFNTPLYPPSPCLGLTQEELDHYRIRFIKPEDYPRSSQGRLFIPIYSMEGDRIGGVARAISKTDERKALTFREAPGLAWFKGKGSGLVVVEDAVSALKASKHVAFGVALLGADLSTKSVLELARGYKLGDPRPVLALDRDASPKAVRLVSMYQGLLPLRFVKLQRDLKDEEDLEEVIRSWT